MRKFTTDAARELGHEAVHADRPAATDKVEDEPAGIYLLVARSRNCTSAARSCSEPIRCSGILVPGV